MGMGAREMGFGVVVCAWLLPTWLVSVCGNPHPSRRSVNFTQRWGALSSIDIQVQALQTGVFVFSYLGRSFCLSGGVRVDVRDGKTLREARVRMREYTLGLGA